MKRTPRMVVVATLLVMGILITWSGFSLGWWYIPLIVSLLWAIAWSPWWMQYLGAVIIALIGSGLPLLVASFHEHIARATTLIAAMMGFSQDGFLVVLLTFLFVLLLSISGAYLGHAIKNVIPSATRANEMNRPLL